MTHNTLPGGGFWDYVEEDLVVRLETGEIPKGVRDVVDVGDALDGHGHVRQVCHGGHLVLPQNNFHPGAVYCVRTRLPWRRERLRVSDESITAMETRESERVRDNSLSHYLRE